MKIGANSNMSDNPLIRVEGVSKKFCRSLKRSLWYGLQDLGNELRGHRHGGDGELRLDEFWAVKDVSFELKRGECLGLIGRNGAGKTTLLRMLNGLIKPDSGSIEMRGRVGGLIALGAGFNPILTGRENIYVNASVMGISKKETDEKIEDIIEFSEIGAFIDMPVQSYSSGMQVRLGFSVATALQPDILLLDEVLAVGDATFRSKCLAKIGSIINQCAVIFVSHDAWSIRRISDSVLWLDGGEKVFQGNTEAGLDRYAANSCIGGAPPLFMNKADFVSEVKYKTSSKIQTLDDGTESHDIDISFYLSSEQKIKTGIFHCNIITYDEIVVAQSDISWCISQLDKGSNRLYFRLKDVRLARGNYSLALAIWDEKGKQLLLNARHFYQFSVDKNINNGCNCIVAATVDFA